MIGRVGDDDFGKRLLSHLRSANVDTKHVRTDPDASSGMSVAIIDAEGDYGAVIVSGANLRLAGRKTSAKRTSCNMQVFLCFKTRFLTRRIFSLRVAKARRPGDSQRSASSASLTLRWPRTSTFWSSTPLRQR